MALLKCIECGHDVSEYAQACPHCGCPISIIKQKQDEYAGADVQVTEKNIQCNSEILCNDSQSCSSNDSIKDSEEKIICKVNGVEYDFTQIYHELMSIDKEDPNWIISEKFDRVMMDVYHLTKLHGPASFCHKIALSGIVPEEYNAMTEEEWENLPKEETPTRPTIRCPYCGSIDVKPLGFFDGGWSAVGNNWKCKNCKSYF